MEALLTKHLDSDWSHSVWERAKDKCPVFGALNAQPASSDALNSLSFSTVKVHIIIADEWLEDEVQSDADILRMCTRDQILDTLDWVLVNADSNPDPSTSTNPQLDNRHRRNYSNFDGIRKAGLVLNSDNAVDVGTSPLIDTMAETSFKMRGDNLSLYRLVWFVSPEVSLEFSKQANVYTQNGLRYVYDVDPGEYESCAGVPVVVSEALMLTDKDGIYQGHAYSDKGQAICVNTYRWNVDYDPEIGISVEHYPRQGLYMMTARLRLRVLSTPRATRILYNINVKRSYQWVILR